MAVRVVSKIRSVGAEDWGREPPLLSCPTTPRLSRSTPQTSDPFRRAPCGVGADRQDVARITGRDFPDEELPRHGQIRAQRVRRALGVDLHKLELFGGGFCVFEQGKQAALAHR